MHILFWRGACRRRFYGQALRGLMMMGALVVALGLFLVGCGSGGSGGSGDAGPGNGGTPTCDISDTDADCDEDGVLNGDDVDADGDGLIEIADALQFDNIRHNLAGSSYDDEAADDSVEEMGDDTGCPAAGGCTGYELSGDIDLKDIANWVPIGETDAAPFVANFNGNGFMVANMAINASSGDRFGLFGSVGDPDVNDVFMFRDVHVQGAITYSDNANAYIGGLIGHIRSPSGGSADVSLIDGCSSAVDISGGSGTSQFIGGLVGFSEAEIRNSWASGAIQSCSACTPDGCSCAGKGSIGGLVGLNRISIRNSFSTGAVSGNLRVGGLVGDNNGAIHNSYATSAVNSGAGLDFIGGLVGRIIGASSEIINSYATGTVDGGVRSSSSSVPQRVGGLAGEINGTITNSHSSGMASGTGNSMVNTVGMMEAQQLMGCGVAAAIGDFGGDCSTLYVGWSSNNWDFGDASQFPALKSFVDRDGDGDNEDPGEDGVLLCGQPGRRVTRPECTTDVKVPLP